MFTQTPEGSSSSTCQGQHIHAYRTNAVRNTKRGRGNVLTFAKPLPLVARQVIILRASTISVSTWMWKARAHDRGVRITFRVILVFWTRVFLSPESSEFRPRVAIVSVFFTEDTGFIDRVLVYVTLLFLFENRFFGELSSFSRDSRQKKQGAHTYRTIRRRHYYGGGREEKTYPVWRSYLPGEVRTCVSLRSSRYRGNVHPYK